MRVFISWSGDLSQQIATILHKFLPCMIHELDVFMSKHDIESGARWGIDLARELEASSFGILCLTPDNLDSRWLHFEAGALTKYLDGRACCLLLDGLTPTDVVSPLSQFQNRPFCRDEFRALLQDINSKLERPLDSDRLSLVFDQWWPSLADEHEKALDSADRTTNRVPLREDREILEEILMRLRTLTSVREGQVTVRGGRLRKGEVLSRPVNYDSLSWYTLWKFPGMDISEHWQRRLLEDFDISKYSTIQELDNVVNRTRKAVEAYQGIKPELFRFGTDYITKSLGFVDEDFRSRHDFGQSTLEAFSQFRELVDNTGDDD